MDAGGHAQNPNFAAGQLGMAGAGLASRRGGQNIKPLSFDALKSPVDKEGVPTPRTSRSHLLAGLRTAPKTAAGTTFPASPTSMAPPAQMFGRNNVSGNGFANAQSYYHTAPKTAMPQFGNSYNHNLMGLSQQYTTEQVLAPPQIRIGDHEQEQLDPNYLAELVATNAYLAEQQQQLQQQLASVQAAASQFSGMNLNHGRPQPAQLQQQLQQQLAYQQAHLRNMQQQQQLMAASAAAQPNIYAYVDPATGQPTYFVDQSAAQLQNNYMMQQAQAYQQMQQATGSPAPRVQVSPPPEAHSSPFRSNSPPKRYDSPAEPAPLPPPSANAFRRGHKKASSLAINSALTPTTGQEPLKSAGPKTAAFPLTPMTGGYGPGQARAGEHPIRQPRGPPSFDELASKPTAKHEGSKNFATRTHRSAVHNLVRAGMERRKGTGSSNGSMSPVSESAEESATPITDNESDSGRSGSGSLSGEMEDSLPSSCTLALGGWGAIGSDRPSSRQKARKSVDSVSSATSGCESDVDNSFASVFKNGAQRTTKAVDVDGQRKGQMLVLTSADKRRGSPMAV